MTPERWKQISLLYEAVRTRPVADRAAFLAEACGSDAALRDEVQSLLDQPTSAPWFEGLAPSVVTQAIGDVKAAVLTGRRFGDYLVGERIDSGGMGDVYRARDTRLGRDVAIKVLQPAFADDPNWLARFEREARLLAALDHPHIGTIYGVEESNGTRALVLALVEGETLAERLARGAIPMVEALELARQIADGLEAAHDKGIIHRDLKPGNIKITPSGLVKVIDFGLAKVVPGSGDLAATSSPISTLDTREGTLLGTAVYMSPEQARGKPADKRADVWAFGCVLFEMLTGRVAFDGESLSDTIAAILGREPEWNALPASTPANVRRLLRRCLEKDPKRRLHDIADVRIELDEPIEAVAPVAFRNDKIRTVARLKWLAAASLLAAILLAGLTTLYLRRAAPELAINRFEISTPPTFEPVSVALSPDGRQLVFIANEEGQQKLWIRPLDQTQAQPLAGTEGASFPFWAPDSRSIGFFADSKLKRLDLGGGQPLVLADAPLPLGGSWSPEGTILFAPSDGLSTQKLMRVAATGGVPVAVPVGMGSPRLPEFLPDGRRFLFFLRYTPDRDGVYVGALDSPEVRRVLAVDNATAYSPSGHLLFVRQGALMAVSFDVSSGTVSGEPVPIAPGVNSNAGRRGAFSASSNGVLAYRLGSAPGRQLTWFDRGGKLVGTMGPPDGNPFASPELSPDGRRVAIGRMIQGNPDVWLLDAGADVWTRFTFSPRAENVPVWAPDGSRLVFVSNRNNRVNLLGNQFFEKPADGSRDERLVFTTPDSHNVRPADWSGDGRTLLYINQSPEDADLWALPLTGDRSPFPVVQTPFFEIEGQFSPDGRWIAYRSNQSGREEIYVQAFPGPGGSQQVSTEGGTQPRWRRDGTELFYVASDNMLMAVAIGPVVGQRLDTSKPVPLFRTRLEGTDQPKQQYAVAPDGQRFLMNVIAEETNVPPITIVQNWDQELKRLVSTR